MKTNKATRSLVAVLTVLVLFLAALFQMPKQAEAEDTMQLAAPTNLHWRGISVPWMAEWDPIEPLETEESERTVEEYNVLLYYGSSADNLTQFESADVYDGALVIANELTAKGEGYYAFAVQAKATEASGKQDSDYAKSDPVFFGKLNVNVQTLDEDGTTDISSEETGGSAFLQAGTGGVRMGDEESAFLPSSMEATLTASAERGYIFKEIKFDPEPSNLSVSGNQANFNLDKSTTATLVFQKNTERVPVIIEFGDKHAALAQQVLAQIQDDSAYTASLDGTTLTIQWPLADTADSPADYIADKVLEAKGPTWGGIDEGEQFNFPIGSKPFDEYTSPREVNEDYSALGNTDISASMTLYLHWAKPAETASFTVEPLVCGTEVEVRADEWAQNPMPNVTASTGSQCVMGTQDTKWYKTDAPAQTTDGPDSWFAGTVKGGDKSYVGFQINQSLGYYIDDNSLPKVTVNGEEAILSILRPWGELGPKNYVVMATLDVEHDWQFKDITWGEGNATAKAYYVCAADNTHTKSVDCTVETNGSDPKKTVYTATVSADKSLDGEEHGDEKTVYAVYNLYVQGVHVTGENCDVIPVTSGKVSFDPESNTLTLDNATIEMSRRNYGFSSDKQEYGIRSNLGTKDNLPGSVVTRGPVTINLIGENKIVNDEIDAETTDKMGIYVASAPSVTYTGEGSLSISMTADESGKKYYGIRQRQNISFDGVTVNVDIDGTAGTTNGMYLENSNTASLTGGAEMHINVGNGYALDSNVQSNEDLSVEEGCVFEAISGGGNGALHGNNWIQLTGDTKALGVMVNAEPTASGRKLWDGTTDFSKYKYVRIPGIKSVTVNYDLGEGHEALAQAETLKTAINSRYAMQVTGVEGSVVKIKVPELSDGNTKNTVARLLSTLRVALNESVGHDPTYGPYWVYDQGQWNFDNALKTIDNYSSYDEINQEFVDAVESRVMPTEGQTIYALWAEPITEVAVTVEPPVCGTEVTADFRDPEDPEMGYNEKTQKPQPVVSVSTEHVTVDEEDGRNDTWWVDSTNKDEPGFTILPPCFTGTMKGGNDYMMVVSVKPDFGYYLPKDVKFTTSNGTVDEELSHGLDTFADAYITVTAEHEFGEWKVTTEPTEDAEGVETRTCNGCDATETRSVPKLVAEYNCVAGDGATWTKGSGKALALIFKRTFNDDRTFSKVKEVLVDGKALTADQGMLSEGSLVVTLKSDFLETLAVGEHTVTAQFEDGEATGTFTVQASDEPTPVPEPTPTPTPEPAPTPAPAPKPAPNPATGDANRMGLALGLALVAGVALSASGAFRKRSE